MYHRKLLIRVFSSIKLRKQKTKLYGKIKACSWIPLQIKAWPKLPKRSPTAVSRLPLQINTPCLGTKERKTSLSFPFGHFVFPSPVDAPGKRALTQKARGAIEPSHCMQLLHPGISKDCRWFQPKFNIKHRNEISFSLINKSYNNCRTGWLRDLVIKYTVRLFVLVNTI